MKTIAIHDGEFHLDELVAIALMRTIHPKIKLIRSRDPAIYLSADMRVDVGGVYDHEKRSYDHHQRGGAGQRSNGIPYASAGLIWKHYGSKLTRGNLEHESDVDKTFIEKVDGLDTGYLAPQGYSIYHAIRSFNNSKRNTDQAFSLCLDFVGELVQNEIVLAEQRLVDDAQVLALANDISHHGTSYVILPNAELQWQRSIVNKTDKLYVIYPDEGMFYVRAVPTEVDAFSLRKPLPEPWRGLQGKALERESKIRGAVFCHPNGFCGGTKTLDGALEMVTRSITYVGDEQ